MPTTRQRLLNGSNTPFETAAVLADIVDGAYAHPGALTGRLYCTWEGATATATAMGAVDTLYVYPFVLPFPLTLVSFAYRLITAGAGSSLKTALWASQSGKPFGAPLAADNTGQATTGAAGQITVAVSATLEPDVYWVGSKTTGTLPAFMSNNTTSHTLGMLLGRASLATLATPVTGLSTSSAYASAMPTLTGGETWTDVVAAGIPTIHLGS